MKNLLFTLTLTLSASLFGMQPLGSDLGSDYEALFEQAIVHAGNYQSDSAAKYLTWIATHDTDAYRLAACHYGLGNINAQNGKYKKAKAYLKRARDQHENLLVREQALLDLGQLYTRENKSKKAICHYKRAFNESDAADIQRNALHHYENEMEFTKIAHILLALQQDSFDDKSSDKAIQSSKKRFKAESLTPAELPSSKMAREVLLRKIKHDEKDTQDT